MKCFITWRTFWKLVPCLSEEDRIMLHEMRKDVAKGETTFDKVSNANSRDQMSIDTNNDRANFGLVRL